jgi:glycosyltransferase involved in cell wall biosynthesis
VALPLGAPHLAIAHGSDVRLLRRLPGGGRLARAIARRADLVYVAEHLRMDGAPGRVVPMGVDVAAWRGGDRERARAALRLEGHTVLFLGRLIRDKGADRAIAALPDGAELLIAGDGPERASLARMAAKKKVRFLGEVRGEAKRDLLAAADVMVVPSRKGCDGAPTVLAEAAAAGLPVVDVDKLWMVTPRSVPSDRYDWSVIGPRLAGRLPLGHGGGRVQVERV